MERLRKDQDRDEDGKRDLDTGSVPESGSMPQKEQQQETIPACQGPDNRETG